MNKKALEIRNVNFLHDANKATSGNKCRTQDRLGISNIK